MFRLSVCRVWFLMWFHSNFARSQFSPIQLFAKLWDLNSLHSSQPVACVSLMGWFHPVTLRFEQIRVQELFVEPYVSTLEVSCHIANGKWVVIQIAKLLEPRERKEQGKNKKQVNWRSVRLVVGTRLEDIDKSRNCHQTELSSLFTIFVVNPIL